jgi:hypothetical protein
MKYAKFVWNIKGFPIYYLTNPRFDEKENCWRADVWYSGGSKYGPIGAFPAHSCFEFKLLKQLPNFLRGK